jgi:hypothetical protein
MRNASTFIEAGGHAEWNYIVFRHNEHQIDEARDLARRMGFKRFFVKRTGRFFKRGELQNGVPILDRAGNRVGWLEVPVSAALRNPAGEEMLQQIRAGTDYDQLLANSTIVCSASSSSGIFISAEGYVFPCCWTAQIYPRKDLSKRKRQVLDLLKQNGGLRAIDANVRSIESIISDSFFQTAVPSGWHQDADRLEVCARQCGDFRLSGRQKQGNQAL